MKLHALQVLGVLALALAACGPRVEPITECPDGAKVVGESPPDGYSQRCMDGDRRHGLSRSWYESGQVRAERIWTDNELHGQFTMYYENGQKRAEGAHLHGEAAGEWTYWDEQGNVLQHREFGDGDAEPSGDEGGGEPDEAEAGVTAYAPGETSSPEPDADPAP